MTNIEQIKDDSILIVSKEQKNVIVGNLSKESTLRNIKVMTFEEVAKRLFFDYDERTLFFLVQEKKVTIDFAKALLEAMYFIGDRKSTNEKLSDLFHLKQELLEKKLLKLDPGFLSMVKRKTIYYEESFATDLEKKIIEKLKEITNVVLLPFSPLEKKKVTIYELETKEEEVRFVIHQIISLYQKGIPFSNMHILNATSEYDYLLPRLLSFYHIPFKKNQKAKLYGTIEGHFFLEHIRQNWEIASILSKMEEEKMITYRNEILEVVNRYVWYQGESRNLFDLLTYDLKQKKLKTKEMKNGISIQSSVVAKNLEDYYFLIGFNQENIPKVYRDEDYLSEKEREELGLDSIEVKNQREKERVIRIIQELPHLTITYKKKDESATFYPSNLISSFSFSVLKKEVETDTIYSDLDHRLIYASLLDEYRKFGIKGKNIEKYRCHYPNFPYQTYDNRYTPIQKEDFDFSLHQKLHLSYSSLDYYYKCRFRYYLGQVLHLDEYEETFARKIGDIFHEVLSKAFLPMFDFKTSYEEATLGKSTNKMEAFFLEKLKGELAFIIETIREQQKNSSLNQAMYEKRIVIQKECGIPVTFTGIVDKIMYQEKDGQTYLVIIDYKTGNVKTKLEYVKYGLDMQLPIYLYLVKNSHLFEHVTFAGFYLQKILNGEPSFNPKKTYQEQKRDALKYVGYSSDDASVVEKVDVDYENSHVIKGMKVGKSGFPAHSNTMSKEAMENLIQLVNQNIDSAIRDILDRKFDINPKVIGKDNRGCAFCQFKDICYKTPNDYVYLEEETLEGGEEDA